MLNPAKTYSNVYIHQFTHVLPINYHSNYTSDLEYSDKLILPPSIFGIIRQSHLPIPPVFSLKFARENSFSVICGVYEFTAEEDYLFCPQWILKKIGKKNKYSNGDAILEILTSKKKNTYTFPLLRKIEICLQIDLKIEDIKKALMMYTVINKGEWLKLLINNKEYKGYIVSILPRNKCIVKHSNFEINIIESMFQGLETEQEEEIKPLLETLPITLLSKEKVVEKRKFDSYTPWEHRVQPIRIEGEGIDLLPWDKEEIIKNEVPTQTLPDIYTPKLNRTKNIKQRKILTLAFPQINIPDRRPLTTLEIDIKYKSISNSPNAQRNNNNRHKSIVY